MRDRLQNPGNYDPVETLALIEYRMRHTQPFFKGSDRRIPEATRSFSLIRQGLKLPEYIEWNKVRDARDAFPIGIGSIEELSQNIEKLNINITELRQNAKFQNLVEAFRAQFRELTTKTISPFIRPTNPWQIEDINIVDRDSTTYDSVNVTRTPDEIDQLRRATGYPAQNAVVYRPERMALHETIAAAVTLIRMEEPMDFLDNFVVSDNGIFKKEILPNIIKAFSKDRFEEDRKTFKEYVNYVINDHFHMVNPNMEIRRELDKARNAIIEQIKQEKYDPRLVESEEILKKLVADDLLRSLYQSQVRSIVDEKIKEYLVACPEDRLPLKSNDERNAWVVAAGPASGKSTLDALVLSEYKNVIGAESYPCQINNDYYRPLLLHKDPSDFAHGSKTQAEAIYIRDMVIDRLKSMIAANRAPDILLSTLAPTQARMELAGCGNARVNLSILSCPMEGPGGTVQRAFNRAIDPTNVDAYNRFVSTRELLSGHRRNSTELPGALGATRRDMRLYNTASFPVTLSASMDSYNRELRILDPQAFIVILRKSFINENAKSEAKLYSGLTDRSLAAAFHPYLEAGVSLNFRYGSNVPNLMLDRLKAEPLPENEKEREKETIKRQLIAESQPESYAWIGHGRAIIRDFQVFVTAFGKDLAPALLTELGQKYEMSVRDYSGHELLSIDGKGNIIYSKSERTEDTELRLIIENTISTITREKESKYDQRNIDTRINETEPSGRYDSGEIRQTETPDSGIPEGRSDIRTIGREGQGNSAGSDTAEPRGDGSRKDNGGLVSEKESTSSPRGDIKKPEESRKDGGAAASRGTQPPAARDPGTGEAGRAELETWTDRVRPNNDDDLPPPPLDDDTPPKSGNGGRE